MRTFSKTAALLLALVAGATTAGAQESGKGFLFGAPTGSVTFRGGWAFPSARSDLFDFTTRNLTINRGDFASAEGGIDLAFRLATKTDVVASIGISGMDKRSEFRSFIDNNDQPIEQLTRFRRVPITLTVKQYLQTPGRSIGRFAWIPSRAAAYVGVGGGIQYYGFRQSGDWVDFNTMNVFTDTFASDGWGPEWHGLLGVDYSLSPRIAVTTEGRYAYSKADLSNDFTGFHRLDLSGFATTVGFTIRY